MSTLGIDLIMDDWRGHLKRATGYLELGMVDQAAEEIENIAPKEKMNFEVLALRVEVFRAAGNWDGMESVASYLFKAQPNEPHWVLNRAWAERRRTGVTAARAILESALPQFPNDANIAYNLACYSCVEGDIEFAKVYLKRAVKLDKALQKVSLDDPDLDALWENLGSSSQSLPV